MKENLSLVIEMHDYDDTASVFALGLGDRDGREQGQWKFVSQGLSKES